MKKILISSLLSSMVILSSLFSANSENNSSKESNQTIEDRNTTKPIEINLDKFRKKSALKDGKREPVRGTFKINGHNDEVAFYPEGHNDEVINIGKDKKVCLLGSKKTLMKGDFKLIINKDNNILPSYPKSYKDRKICISTDEIEKGDLILIEDKFGNVSVRIDIKMLNSDNFTTTI